MWEKTEYFGEMIKINILSEIQQPQTVRYAEQAQL